MVNADQTATAAQGRQWAAGQRIRAALRDVDDMWTRGFERDRLWIVLSETITTQTNVEVTPRGSTARVLVTSEHASAELIAAWEWLIDNEPHARGLGPIALYRTLRGAATKSCNGSGRAAMADGMCGLTQVPAGIKVAVRGGDAIEQAS